MVTGSWERPQQVLHEMQIPFHSTSQHRVALGGLAAVLLLQSVFLL
jgi:hypothetical protein